MRKAHFIGPSPAVRPSEKQIVTAPSRDRHRMVVILSSDTLRGGELWKDGERKGRMGEGCSVYIPSNYILSHDRGNELLLLDARRIQSIDLSTQL